MTPQMILDLLVWRAAAAAKKRRTASGRIRFQGVAVDIPGSAISHSAALVSAGARNPYASL